MLKIHVALYTYREREKQEKKQDEKKQNKKYCVCVRRRGE